MNSRPTSFISSLSLLEKTIDDKSLPENTRLYVDISNQDIGNAEAIRLAALLPHLPKNTYLNLANNYISEPGIKAIALVFKKGECPEGTSLNLDGNPDSAMSKAYLSAGYKAGHCQQFNISYRYKGFTPVPLKHPKPKKSAHMTAISSFLFSHQSHHTELDIPLSGKKRKLNT